MPTFIIVLIHLVAAYALFRLYYLHTIVKRWTIMQEIYRQDKRDKAQDIDVSGLTKISLEYSRLFDPRYWFMPELLTIRGNERLFYIICYLESIHKHIKQQQNADTKQDSTPRPVGTAESVT